MPGTLHSNSAQGTQPRQTRAAVIISISRMEKGAEGLSNLPEITDPWPDCGSGQSQSLNSCCSTSVSPQNPISESPLCVTLNPAYSSVSPFPLLPSQAQMGSEWHLAHPGSQTWSPAEPWEHGLPVDTEQEEVTAGPKGAWSPGSAGGIWPRLHTPRS